MGVAFFVAPSDIPIYHGKLGPFQNLAFRQRRLIVANLVKPQHQFLLRLHRTRPNGVPSRLWLQAIGPDKQNSRRLSHSICFGRSPLPFRRSRCCPPKVKGTRFLEQQRIVLKIADRQCVAVTRQKEVRFLGHRIKVKMACDVDHGIFTACGVNQRL